MFGKRGRAGIALFGVLLLASGCSRNETRITSGAHAGLACAACHRGSSGTEFASGATCAKCHSEGALSAEVELAGVRFPHLAHGEISPGVPTYCGACHVHASGQEDLRVDATSCFLCHAQLPAPGARDAPDARAAAATLPASECLDCHGQPQHVAFENTGFPVDHATVVRRGISCVQCHYDLVEGTGTVEDATCRECHGAIGASLLGNEPRDAETVHRQHAAGGAGPACARCHEPVTHRVGKVASSLELVCRDCHAADSPAMKPPIDAHAHRPEQLLYTGLFEAEGITPAHKFLERVACRDCHAAGTFEHGRGTPERSAALERECESCHGAGYASLLDGWTHGMRAHTERVGRYVSGPASDARIRAAGADSAAAAALRTWEFVRDAGGVHNLPAAAHLLRQSLQDAAAAYERAGLPVPEVPGLGPDPAEQSCARCHYGVEELLNSPGTEAYHRAHVANAGIACTRCHSAGEPARAGMPADAPHGLTTVTSADCMSCHHRSTSEASCATCHADADLAGSLTATVSVAVADAMARPREVSWTHEAHAGIACTTCHTQPGNLAPSGDVASCVACHDEHHAPERDCNACHRGTDLMAAHAAVPDKHADCHQCHGTETIAKLLPDRSLCVVCHGPQSVHYVETGKSCVECHFLAGREAFRSRLVGGGGQ